MTQSWGAWSKKCVLRFEWKGIPHKMSHIFFVMDHIEFCGVLFGLGFKPCSLSIFLHAFK